MAGAGAEIAEIGLVERLALTSAECPPARGGGAPVNAVVTSITKRIQAGELTPTTDNLALALQELTA